MPQKSRREACDHPRKRLRMEAPVAHPQQDLQVVVVLSPRPEELSSANSVGKQQEVKGEQPSAAAGRAGNGLAARRALHLCVALPSCVGRPSAEDTCVTELQPPLINIDNQLGAADAGANITMPGLSAGLCSQHPKQATSCGHWQARCRGCGQLTGHEYMPQQGQEAAYTVGRVPFCRTCSSQLVQLPHYLRAKLEDQLLWLHSKWCAAGL